jgi:hypothetical protein
MEVQFTVNLVELRHAVRRLLARLPDESAAGDDSIVFHASGNSLEIVAGGTSEVLGAAVVHPGKARIPHHVFRTIARSLQFHGGRSVAIVVSPAVLKINRTEYRHPSISIPNPARGQAFVGVRGFKSAMRDEEKPAE